jgi:hypothetical protein
MGGYNLFFNNCQNFCEKMFQMIDLEHKTRRQCWPVTSRDVTGRLLSNVPVLTVLIQEFRMGVDRRLHLSFKDYTDLCGPVSPTLIPSNYWIYHADPGVAAEEKEKV